MWYSSASCGSLPWGMVLYKIPFNSHSGNRGATGNVWNMELCVAKPSQAPHCEDGLANIVLHLALNVQLVRQAAGMSSAWAVEFYGGSGIPDLLSTNWHLLASKRHCWFYILQKLPLAIVSNVTCFYEHILYRCFKYFEVCFRNNQQWVDCIRDTIYHNVYDGGMVFYNVSFLEIRFLQCIQVFAIFCSYLKY